MNEMPFTSPADFSAGVASQSPSEQAYWFVFKADRLLVELGPPSPHPSGDPRVPSRASWAKLPLLKNNNWLWFEPARTLYLGRLAGTDCWAAEAPREAEAPPPGMGWEGLRALFSVLEDAHFAVAGRAIQLLDWDRSHRFCGRCGTPTEAKTEERSRVCPACKLSAYPRLSPAVMALVRREGEILLGRSPHFPPGMYSALAGFVEPGETIEDCVRREVREEVGVDVANIKYFASQSWPFPHSLMIAYTAEHAGGDIRIDDAEIAEARWFAIDDLPKLPSSVSIARRLIDATVARLQA
jgi:NAD+ diphosphatase